MEDTCVKSYLNLCAVEHVVQVAKDGSCDDLRARCIRCLGISTELRSPHVIPGLHFQSIPNVVNHDATLGLASALR